MPNVISAVECSQELVELHQFVWNKPEVQYECARVFNSVRTLTLANWTDIAMEGAEDYCRTYCGVGSGVYDVFNPDDIMLLAVVLYGSTREKMLKGD